VAPAFRRANLQDSAWARRPGYAWLLGVAALALLLLLLPLPILFASPLDETLPLISAGRYVQAQAHLTPYVQAHPEELGARYWLGRALLGAGRREAAIDQLRMVLEKKPTSSDSRLCLAQALWELRRPAEALAQLQELLRRDPRHAAAKAMLERLKQGERPVIPIQPDLDGGQIAFINGGLPIDPGNVDLQTYHLKDYTFSEAPSEWLITSGTWATSNRWTCSPQWSWYGGHAIESPATIWTKEEFAGDQVVETYFGFIMGLENADLNYSNVPRAYTSVNGVCLSLCGDGANPASGYTFMIGGDRNKSTRIMKGTKILAESNKPEALFFDWTLGQPKNMYLWHRHWWAFRAVKAGTRLQLWYEGKLVVEAHDPDPLPSGRTALWVYDNGIIVPRLRIYYQSVVRPRTEPAGQAAWIQPVTSLGTAPLTVTSASHPSFQNDFEYGLGNFRTLDPDTGALLSLVPGGPRGNGHCLAVIDRISGGNYSAMAVADRLDAHDYSRLAFDYRLPPEAKVNLYLTAQGRRMEIQFSGRPEPAPKSTMIGKIEGVQADNQWHHAEFDLLGALTKVLGAAGTPVFQNLQFANFNNADYLGAGFGGNPAGCTYYLDNFYLGTPRQDTTVKLTWQPPTGAQYSGYAVSLDQNPTAPAGQPTSELPAEITAPAPGLWYLHVQAKKQDGSSAGTVNWAVHVAGVAPKAGDPASSRGTVSP